MSGTIGWRCLTTINGIRCYLPAGHEEPCRFAPCPSCVTLRDALERVTRERDALKVRLETALPDEVCGDTLDRALRAEKERDEYRAALLKADEESVALVAEERRVAGEAQVAAERLKALADDFSEQLTAAEARASHFEAALRDLMSCWGRDVDGIEHLLEHRDRRFYAALTAARAVLAKGKPRAKETL